MSAHLPLLSQVNIVAQDFEAALAFYRALGIPVHDGVAHDGCRHAEAVLPNGLRLELDNQPMAALTCAAWRTPQGGSRALLGFRLSTREAVDELYAQLTAAGHPGRQSPFDTFWGARYAVVADPCGNDVGLMSPPDPGHQSWPPVPSP